MEFVSIACATLSATADPGGSTSVVGVPGGVSAARYAQWLAALAQALEDARALVRLLEAECRYDEIGELRELIEEIRSEVRQLRLNGSAPAPAQCGPKWTKSLPWQTQRPQD